MSTEDCRKLVSQICAIVGVRTPQIIVNEITDRERRLKHVSLIYISADTLSLRFEK